LKHLFCLIFKISCQIWIICNSINILILVGLAQFLWHRSFLFMKELVSSLTFWTFATFGCFFDNRFTSFEIDHTASKAPYEVLSAGILLF
jgi:hypothetical protein